MELARRALPAAIVPLCPSANFVKPGYYFEVATRLERQIVNFIGEALFSMKLFKSSKLFLHACATAALFGLIAMHDVYAQGVDADFKKKMEAFLGTDEGQKLVGDAVQKHFEGMQKQAQKKQEDLAAAELENQFKTPVKMEVGSSPVKGPEGAKVTIIEFSDFQCPYCQRGKDTMDQILKAYPNDVKVAFKHLPLPFHKEAMPAAKASWAAGKQGKFWEFHDALFANQGSLGETFYSDTAKKLSLDVKKFDEDRNSKAAEEAVKADMEVAQKNGIQGTPGFFVNGVAVKGAYPFDHFKKIVDRWLTGKA